jgi:hypothetical protein
MTGLPVAKVEGAAGPRRQGCSCSNLPQALDNAGDAVPSAFPWVNNTVKKDSFLDITGSRIQYVGNK